MTDQQHRLHDLHVEHAGEAHSESLRLQRTVRDRFASRNGKRGKRRKGGDVIDLNDPMVVVRRRTSRLLIFFFWVEVVVAVVGVTVLAVYMFLQRSALF